MSNSSPLVRTLGQSIFLRDSAADDVAILAETAKFLNILDEWFTDEGLIYLRIGTVTVALQLDAAESFVRGLLQRYDDGVRCCA